MTNDKANTLSKSRYCKGVQCSKMLWLGNHPEIAKPTPVDPMVQMRFDVGQRVGDLAVEYFGDFLEMDYRVDYSEEKEEMIAATKALMDKNVPIIAEASFSFDNNFCSVDILRVVEGGHELIEVKSSSFYPEGTCEDIKNEKKKYIYLHDMAYQVYVLSQLGISIKSVSLMMLNRKYVKGGELDVQELFVLVDCTEEIFSMLPDVPKKIEEIKREAYQEMEPDKDVGIHCFRPYECGFREYCFSHLPEDNIFTVGWEMRVKKQEELYKEGWLEFGDIARGISLGDIELTAKQERHVRTKVDNLDPHIDKIAVGEFLSQLRFPLYFLDFESFQQAIPEWDGVFPYRQIPFQYSLHIQQEDGGEITHKEFLAEEGTNPLWKIAKQLCQDIPMAEESSVLVYSQVFEKGVIKNLAEQFPDLKEHLMWIHNHILDLAKPFQGGAYYSGEMGGSYSIKAVLPALFPDDPELDYGKLEFIQSGGDAMTIFPILHTKSPEEIAVLRKALLEYCHLDTLAMVKIVEKLREVVN